MPTGTQFGARPLRNAASIGVGCLDRRHPGATPTAAIPSAPARSSVAHQLPTAAEIDPDLARVVTAWPDLPTHIRAAVLALVGTAR